MLLRTHCKELSLVVEALLRSSIAFERKQYVCWYSTFPQIWLSPKLSHMRKFMRNSSLKRHKKANIGEIIQFALMEYQCCLSSLTAALTLVFNDFCDRFYYFLSIIIISIPCWRKVEAKITNNFKVISFYIPEMDTKRAVFGDQSGRKLHLHFFLETCNKVWNLVHITVFEANCLFHLATPNT
jgi:hypothetical protein